LFTPSLQKVMTELCSQALCSESSVYGPRWSLPAEKDTCKKTVYSTPFRFCNDKLETISVYGM